MLKKKILLIGFGLALLAATTFLYLSSRHSVLAQEAYNIVFLTTPENVSSNLVQQLQILAPNTRTVQNFEEVRSADVDALVVDSAAISLVDNTWAQDAYRRGVVISGINLQGAEIARITGSSCAVPPIDASNDFYVAVSRILLASNTADSQLIEAAEQRTCNGNEAKGVTGFVVYTNATAASYLRSQDDYREFVQTIDSQIRNVRESIFAFNNPNQLPIQQ